MSTAASIRALIRSRAAASRATITIWAKASFGCTDGGALEGTTSTIRRVAGSTSTGVLSTIGVFIAVHAVFRRDRIEHDALFRQNVADHDMRMVPPVVGGDVFLHDIVVEPGRRRAGQAADDAGRGAERRSDNRPNGAADRSSDRATRRAPRSRAGVGGVVAGVLGISRRGQSREQKGKYEGF